MLLYMVAMAIIKYQEHPVETVIEAKTAYTAMFPAITICNLNAMRQSAANSLRDFSNLVGVRNITYYQFLYMLFPVNFACFYEFI